MTEDVSVSLRVTDWAEVKVPAAGLAVGEGGGGAITKENEAGVLEMPNADTATALMVCEEDTWIAVV